MMKRREDKVKGCFVSLFPFLGPEFDDRSKAELAYENNHQNDGSCLFMSFIFFGLSILSC
jgi:hypothetical protein